jgi:hypothetical protein
LFENAWSLASLYLSKTWKLARESIRDLQLSQF